MRLARALGTSERFWLGLQDDYDLEQVREKRGREIEAIHNVAA